MHSHTTTLLDANPLLPLLGLGSGLNGHRRLVVAISVSLASTAFAFTRSPISAPLPDMSIERELLAGSDALLERMVIPPNRPDWILTDCTKAPEASVANNGSAYDRMRHALCEAARKSNATVSSL